MTTITQVLPAPAPVRSGARAAAPGSFDDFSRSLAAANEPPPEAPGERTAQVARADDATPGQEGSAPDLGAVGDVVVNLVPQPAPAPTGAASLLAGASADTQVGAPAVPTDGTHATDDRAAEAAGQVPAAGALTTSAEVVTVVATAPAVAAPADVAAAPAAASDAAPVDVVAAPAGAVASAGSAPTPSTATMPTAITSGAPAGGASAGAMAPADAAAGVPTGLAAAPKTAAAPATEQAPALVAALTDPVVAPVPTPRAPTQAAPVVAPAVPSVPQQAAPLDDQLRVPLGALRTLPFGDHILTLRVEPRDLGPVQVRAHLGADGLRVELVGATDTVREQLRAVLPDLRRELAATGGGDLSLDEGTIAERDGRNAEREAPDARPGVAALTTNASATADRPVTPTDDAARHGGVDVIA
ncbi:flagellar hook-length control protein FliK [Sanguibacter sp. HDW7]|uniref:flagellar hook-length control protein FliK n=1 Tax=Sanguibacter sp. HDW7 TaxID=2714931 RepID=UPI00140B4C6F|nr:flagellar hook-length control protein FliK [Sanguibacter sp. HDW7]QIK84303.1 flagellar hook-length control protein FliK [Sanguibacter sp. HDW7]